MCTYFSCLACVVVILFKLAVILVVCVPWQLCDLLLTSREPFVLPLSFVSLSLYCLCLYNSVKWPTSSLNLSVACGQLVFDISFHR